MGHIKNVLFIKLRSEYQEYLWDYVEFAHFYLNLEKYILKGTGFKIYNIECNSFDFVNYEMFSVLIMNPYKSNIVFSKVCLPTPTNH